MNRIGPCAALLLAAVVPALLPGADADPPTIKGHQSSVMAVAYSPDGKTLASGGSGPEAAIRLWPVAPPPK